MFRDEVGDRFREVPGEDGRSETTAGGPGHEIPEAGLGLDLGHGLSFDCLNLCEGLSCSRRFEGGDVREDVGSRGCSGGGAHRGEHPWLGESKGAICEKERG